MLHEQHTIRQTGTHYGKTIVLGFDRYLLPDLDRYLDCIGRYGEVEVVGDLDDLHYLSSAVLVCEQMQTANEAVGILVCGTGLGMSIAANKFRTIYATRCTSRDDASMARTINNSNVLCMASMSGFDLNREIVEAFMTTPYEGRKLEQLEYITQLELESRPAPPAEPRNLRVLRPTA